MRVPWGPGVLLTQEGLEDCEGLGTPGFWVLIVVLFLQLSRVLGPVQRGPELP